jgi:hypothetical protein
MLKLIGYWIRNLHDDDFPAPHEVVAPLPMNIRLRLVRYLEHGTFFEKYRGYSWCRFGCGISEDRMGSREFTDGDWVWPEGLAHYVAAHGVTPPEEFVAHALSETPVQPVRSHNDVDTTFWISWCAQRRSLVLARLLREARQEAEAKIVVIHQAKIESLEREHGLSESKCIWRGCERRALCGMSICAEHGLSDTERQLFLGGATFGVLREILQRLELETR